MPKIFEANFGHIWLLSGDKLRHFKQVRRLLYYAIASLYIAYTSLILVLVMLYHTSCTLF